MLPSALCHPRPGSPRSLVEGPALPGMTTLTNAFQQETSQALETGCIKLPASCPGPFIHRERIAPCRWHSIRGESSDRQLFPPGFAHAPSGGILNSGRSLVSSFSERADLPAHCRAVNLLADNTAAYDEPRWMKAQIQRLLCSVSRRGSVQRTHSEGGFRT